MTNQSNPVDIEALTTPPAKPQGEAKEWTLVNDRNEGSYRIWIEKGPTLPFEVPVKVREILSSEAARVPPEAPVLQESLTTDPPLHINPDGSCPVCHLHPHLLMDRIKYLEEVERKFEAQDTTQPTRLLEAAKAVVMMWHIGSEDKLKDAVKSLNNAIEAQGVNEK